MKELYLPEWKLQEWKEMANGSYEEQVHRLECIADWFVGFSEDENNWKELRDLRHVLNAVRCVSRDHKNEPGWRRHVVLTLYGKLREIVVAEHGEDVWNTVDAI